MRAKIRSLLQTKDLLLGAVIVGWGYVVYRLQRACGKTWDPLHGNGEPVTITNTIGPVFEARQGARDAMAVWATDVETAAQEASRWNELSLYAAQQATRIAIEEYEAEYAV